ncbi:hypothetical protein E2C01_041919 [Portunus trituberculatus]|uniref:Secreted protein n=1 Tax=Portunus trituberculatus TaxID=210409 RepID=A0A5B7FL39_PORTR|nr:hypothetical protein [Portunus trituberculatus]
MRALQWCLMSHWWAASDPLLVGGSTSSVSARPCLTSERCPVCGANHGTNPVPCSGGEVTWEILWLWESGGAGTPYK